MQMFELQLSCCSLGETALRCFLVCISTCKVSWIQNISAPYFCPKDHLSRYIHRIFCICSLFVAGTECYPRLFQGFWLAKGVTILFHLWGHNQILEVVFQSHLAEGARTSPVPSPCHLFALQRGASIRHLKKCIRFPVYRHVNKTFGTISSPHQLSPRIMKRCENMTRAEELYNFGSGKALWKCLQPLAVCGQRFCPTKPKLPPASRFRGDNFVAAGRIGLHPCKISKTNPSKKKRNAPILCISMRLLSHINSRGSESETKRCTDNIHQYSKIQTTERGHRPEGLFDDIPYS